MTARTAPFWPTTMSPSYQVALRKDLVKTRAKLRARLKAVQSCIDEIDTSLGCKAVPTATGAEP